jgi:glycosyltransferase involved in cell wall biosynthesis
MRSRPMTKKRVLVLASTFPRWKNDNQPHFVLDFAAQISNQHDVYVLAPYDKGARFKEKIGNIIVYRFPYFIPGLEKLAYRGGMVNSFKKSYLAKIQLPVFLSVQFLYLFWLSLSKRVDVIIPHWLFPQGFIANFAKKFLRKKMVLVTHGGDIAMLQKRWASRLLKRTLTNLDHVTFVSEKNLHKALDSTGLNKTKRFSVLPMGIHVPRLKKIENDGVNLLFIGRLVEIKGLDYLIKALPSVIKKHPQTHLTILGDGPLRPNLTRLVDRLNLQAHISFEGFLLGKAKDSHLRKANIVVVPSIIDKAGYEEGLPVAALEAMAYGKVLIGTNTGSMSSLINQKNGILVQPNDSNALASAIVDALDNTSSWPQVASAAIETAKNYDWAIIGNKASRILETI